MTGGTQLPQGGRCCAIRLRTPLTADGFVQVHNAPFRCSRQGPAKAPSDWSHDQSELEQGGAYILDDSQPHTLQRASVGDIRAARRAGQSPATAPIQMAAAIPPAQARTGMTTSSCL